MRQIGTVKCPSRIGLTSPRLPKRIGRLAKRAAVSYKKLLSRKGLRGGKRPPRRRVIGIPPMVYRPRTPYVKALKKKRCPKCGTLVNRRVRCKVCHKLLKK
jgi:hypothetical protein